MQAKAVAEVVRLLVYPLKACQGVSIDKINVGSLGFEHDRMFCVVDLDGDRYPERQALSQRQVPKLAAVKVEYSDRSGKKQLVVSAPDMERKLIVDTEEEDFEDNGDVLVNCEGKSTTSSGGWSMGVLPGKSAGEDATSWFTEYLNKVEPSSGKRKLPKATFCLVRALSKNAARKLAIYAGPKQVPYSADTKKQKLGFGSPFKMRSVNVKSTDALYFQDFAPCNICSVDSLEELSEVMSDAAEKSIEHPVQCFRPNIVVKNFNDSPFDEETWKFFQVGDSARFRHLKLTPRCTVPARNPTTGDWLYPFKKLLVQKTLKRMFPKKCLDIEWEEQWQGPSFGVHLGYESEASGSSFSLLKLGDKVRVFSFKDLPATSYSWSILCSHILALGITLCVLFMIIDFSKHY